MYNVTIARLVVAKLMYDAHSYINAQRSRDYAASKGGRA